MIGHSNKQTKTEITTLYKQMYEADMTSFRQIKRVLRVF